MKIAPLAAYLNNVRRKRRRLTPETRSLIDRFDVRPDVVRSDAIDALVRSLQDAGVWAKLDALYLTAAHDEQAARLNWVEDAFNLAPQGGPVFTVDRGFQGDGVGAYLNTGFNPSAAPSAYTLDSAHVSTWGLTAHAAGVYLPAGMRDADNAAGRLQIIPRLADMLNVRVNSFTPIAVANTETQGLFVANRPDASNMAAYLNGASIASGAVPSLSLPNAELYLLAQNTAGTGANSFSPSQLAAATVGAGLTDDEVAALHSALGAYLQLLGAI